MSGWSAERLQEFRKQQDPEAPDDASSAALDDLFAEIYAALEEAEQNTEYVPNPCFASYNAAAAGSSCSGGGYGPNPVVPFQPGLPFPVPEPVPVPIPVPAFI